MTQNTYGLIQGGNYGEAPFDASRQSVKPEPQNPLVDMLAQRLGAVAPSNMADKVLGETMQQFQQSQPAVPLNATMEQQLSQGVPPGPYTPPPNSSMGQPLPPAAGPNWGMIMQGMQAAQGSQAGPPAPAGVMPIAGSGRVSLKPIGGKQNPYSFMGG